MPSFSQLLVASISTPFLFGGLALGLPTTTTSSSSAAVAPRDSTPASVTCPASGRGKEYARALYRLLPGSPDVALPPTLDLHVQYHNYTGLTIQQAVVFGPFPAGARNCAFGWAQEDVDRGAVFVAAGSGLLTVHQLSGFPIGAPLSVAEAEAGGEEEEAQAAAAASGVSYAAVQPFVENARLATHPDFTSWDREANGTTHTSGPGSIECSGAAGEHVYVLIQLEPPTTGNVYLERSGEAGIFVEYNCEPEA
ncbi:hypothetical protein GGS23DRAFT_520155 [Durotheca rogersii]|uniref:uncharacterized protein n=1 Tax=Durotheca rogersii TaxID=419775 RepID=UPI00221F31BB|nr:uncharacterized protein GGS23DRAFT_520155 [Durotheca rogersii]KAI5863914.1 hypothetical protein GGS23DRAFT_520155 [Durotheca rogersii]